MSYSQTNPPSAEPTLDNNGLRTKRANCSHPSQPVIHMCIGVTPIGGTNSKAIHAQPLPHPALQFVMLPPLVPTDALQVLGPTVPPNQRDVLLPRLDQSASNINWLEVSCTNLEKPQVWRLRPSTLSFPAETCRRQLQQAAAFLRSRLWYGTAICALVGVVVTMRICCQPLAALCPRDIWQLLLHANGASMRALCMSKGAAGRLSPVPLGW